MQKFKMMFKDLVTLTASIKLQYIRTILHIEALGRFYTLCDQLVSMNTTHLNLIFLGLGMYFPPVNTLSKKKRAMCCGPRRTQELNVKCYADFMIDLNEYLAAFTA